MSHYSYIKIRIKNPNIQLLKKTIKDIAEEMNAEIVDEIRDYYGNRRRDFIIGLRNNTFRRGVGIQIRDGEVKLVGDFWNIPRNEINRLQKKIIQHYTKNAMIVSMQKLGYQQFQTNKVENKIYIKAMGW